MEAALKAGDTLSERYRIEQLIGAGGMGKVFLAHDEQLGRAVAIKILPPELSSDDRVRRFANEARAVSALNHPNIVTIHEIGSVDSIRFMVTEFIDGETLRHWVTTSRRDPRKEIDVMTQIATGLAKAHAAGVVHRDIKPENVMITRDGHAKILDFGLAKLRDPDAISPTDVTIEHKTADGVVVGTTAYLSPEQAEGRTVDHRSDIFSLGVVMYELVARRRPFEGRTTVDTLHQIINSEPKPLTAYDPNVPYELQRIVKKCLAKDPDDRYQSANDLAVDLRALGREFDSLPRSSGPISPAARSKAPLIIAAACVVAVAIVVAVVMSRGRGSAVPHENLAIERVTHTGDIGAVALSPDGRYLVGAQSRDGLSSLVIIQLATRSEVTIIAPAAVSFGAVAFSRDGNYIWFSRRSSGKLYYLFRVPTLGGADLQMHSAPLPLGGWFALSPDEHSFLLHGAGSPGVRVLQLARLGESSVKPVIRRVLPEQILGAPVWAPDSKRFAFFAGSVLPHWHMTMFVHDVQTGAEARLATREWSGLWGGEGVWTPDGKSLIVAAADNNLSPRQLWEVDAATGAARAITHDVDEYRGLSITADGRTLAAIRQVSDSNIWRVDVGNPASARQITFDTSSNTAVWGLRWLSPTRLIYSAVRQGEANLWSINGDGTGNRVVVAGSSDVYPSVSPDGTHIAFSSERSGVWHLWTMKIDGSDARMFPKTERGVRPTYSPDGRWIVYMSWSEAVFRIDASNPDATPVPVTTDRCWSPTFTPDGQAILCYTPAAADSNDPDRTLLVPLDGGPVRTLNIPARAAYRGGAGIFRFMADGRLIYRTITNGASNLALHSLKGSEAPQVLTQFTSGVIEDFDVSPDGKSIAVSRSSTSRDVLVLRNFH